MIIVLLFSSEMILQMEQKVSDGTDILTVGFLWTSDGIWSPMDERVSEINKRQKFWS